MPLVLQVITIHREMDMNVRNRHLSHNHKNEPLDEKKSQGITTFTTIHFEPICPVAIQNISVWTKVVKMGNCDGLVSLFPDILWTKQLIDNKK